MPGIMPLTPLLSTHPEYVALSGQTRQPFASTCDYEYGEIILEVDGVRQYSSGLIEANTLVKREFTTRWPLIRRKSRLYLTFTSIRRGYPRTVTIPMRFPKKKTDQYRSFDSGDPSG
jgi:hypothetical protein